MSHNQYQQPDTDSAANASWKDPRFEDPSLCTKIPLLSADMVRTKTFDGSAKLSNSSFTQKPHDIYSVFSEVDPDHHYLPSERIARHCTSAAAGLTMKHAAKIAADGINSKKPTPKVVGYTLAATAPDAFEASQRIAEIALAEGGPNSPKQKDLKKQKTKLEADAREHEKPLPCTKSALAIREANRFARNKKGAVVMKPSKPAVNPFSEGGAGFRTSFDDWNPTAMDEEEVVVKSLPDEASVEERLNDRVLAVKRLQNKVAEIAESGVLTAVGSGHRVAVPDLTTKNLDSIIARVPTNYRLLEAPAIRLLLEKELETTRVNYNTDAALCCVLHDLLNPVAAKNMACDLSRVGASDVFDLWTNKEYQSKEYRVLRKTGVRNDFILKVFRNIQKISCAQLPIMLELQYLWTDEYLPDTWWSTMPSVRRCTYSNLLFTDVNQLNFRHRLPFHLDDFTAHIESHSKDVRDALAENWLALAGGKLSGCIFLLDDDGKALREDITNTSAVQGNDEFDVLANTIDPDSEEEGEARQGRGIVNSIRGIQDKSAQLSRQLKKRMSLESGGNAETGKKAGTVSDKDTLTNNRKSRNLAERIVDTAAVQMSKHLRSACEASLTALSDLFNNLTKPSTAGYAIFVLNLKLRRKNNDVTNDMAGVSTHPVHIGLQPDLAEVKLALSGSVRCLVSAARDFARAETILGSNFGGPNSFMLENALLTNRHRKINESCVGFSDAIVVQSNNIIHQCIAQFFEGPMNLLKEFTFLDNLLCGQTTQKVSQSIAECVGSGKNTTESLEQLALICKDLDVLMEKIGSMVPDVCHFPMFEVRTAELKEQLTKYVRNLHTQVLDAIVEENRNHMMSICSKYQEIANTLVTEAASAAELKVLQDYTNKAAITLLDLNDQYLTQSYERIRFLLANKYKMARDDIQILYTTYNWPLNIQQYLKRSFESQSTKKKDLETLLEEDQRKLENDIIDIAKRVETLADNSLPMDFRKNVDRIAAIKRDLDTKQEVAEEINERETLLDVPHLDHLGRLEEVRANVEPLERLWAIIKTFVEKTHVWHDSSLPDVEPEEAERTADELQRALMKISKEFEKVGEKRGVAKKIADSLCMEVKEFMSESIPLMLLICNPGMRDRHWKEIESITGIAIPYHDVLNMNTMLELGLQQYVKNIEDVCVSASKEYGLQVALDKMEEEWDEMMFNTKEYRTSGTRILSSVDEIQMKLDDHIVKTQAMKSSRFIKPLIERCTTWEGTLIDMQEIMDNWLKVQATWLYLEPIFSSDDIMRQMPTEGRMFRQVDLTWRSSMSQTYDEPGCVKVARRPGFLDSLIEANKILEVIQKGLNDYLETKRLAFPRFFFLSNDELLEILAETKDPLRVQPHLKKCFDGIAELKFEGNLDITACFDPKKEKLEFPYAKINHKKINPNDSGGNVERWLIEVELVMKKALAFAIDCSMADYLASVRTEWLHRWQGQVIIAVNQVSWCHDVEAVLIDGAENGLSTFYQKLCAQLLQTVELVRGNLEKNMRVAVGSLVVMDVHNRDTINEMAEAKVGKITEFDWLAQLRYYWSNDGVSSQTGNPATITCRMINAMALYAYEYIGNQDRLVITPLTDRCYRTLMGAIHLNLGGAPEGPAGTGKTETVKDLGKAIAIQCVVTNCSDGLDYLAMAKFFKGLASAGAWACFDEFNRIQLEVLSVVAQQIMQIQIAKVKGVEKFIFEGSELSLRVTCCPFITMNPGYAGRAELPDNLKVLFRTVAMMVPDYGMISEIILYSFGYTTAKPLSVKIVTTYKLCSEQLSSQSHYDYGMRAVIAVLRAAGNLKRSDGHLPEDVLVLRSIIDVNLPKFLSPDVPLFEGITSDLFPGVTVDPPDRDAMEAAFKTVCERRSLCPEPYFWDKLVQIYDMMVVRHGFMIVGAPFSGKTSSWNVLSDVLALLHERFPSDKRWSKVLHFMQNPKSITMGQLYGQFDPVSHEWTDGILAINFRNAAANKVGNPEDRKWMLFDGPVDAIWIENMNTVLDDNKKLCLMSGEIIAMSDVMSMMFEPMDLLVASPATVSRCGMIYMESDKLGWRPLVDAWLESYKRGGQFEKNEKKSPVELVLYPNDAAHVISLVDWLLEPCICWVRKDGTEMSPTVDSNLVSSCLNILECTLSQAFAKYVDETDNLCEPTDLKLVRKRQQDIECCFFFALVWSVGKTGTDASQTKFSLFLDDIVGNIDCIEMSYTAVHNALQIRKWKKPDFQGTFKGSFQVPMPKRVDYYECLYSASESRWKTWVDMLTDFSIPPNSPFNSIVVPNIYTAQYAYVLELLVTKHKHVLMCASTGTGKTAYIQNTITSVLPQDQYKSLCLGFSAKTSANMTQEIIDGKLDKRRKGVYGPPAGFHSIIFVDDLNMPEVETYGAQPPIELVRQLIDNGGWYDLKEKSWRSIVSTSLVSAMGPPGGGRNFVTPRLLRHFNLFCFPEFDDNTLRRIFSTIVHWHFQGSPFAGDVRMTGESIIEATLDTYRSAMRELLPTPQKSHYTFNLRDYSRIIQGVLLCRPADNFNKNSLIRLWVHEALRVFGDRLVDDDDRQWFHHHLEVMCTSKFGIEFFDLFKHLDKSGSGILRVADMRNLLIGDYMSSEDGNKPYVEVEDMAELSLKMEEYLTEYNAQSKKPMDLVLFGFAVEHISRISRVLKMPGGNALLVGVGGSGRQSVTKMSAFISNYSVFQIEISKNYTNVEWREDLKLVLKGAGTGAQPFTFLFSDTQIKNETFVEDINNILNSGEVPNIFPSDERVQICEAVRPIARQVFGKVAQDMNTIELYSFFIQRVRSNLHVVLAFSPIGEAFRDRLRKFPALINCCTIDWFTAWPQDALVAVAQKFLADVEFVNEQTRHNIVELCQQIHTDVTDLSEEFFRNLKRRNYVTPTSYLELIIAFKGSLNTKRIEVAAAKKRYEVGLEKLAFAAEQVNTMQTELADLQPELVKAAADTQVLMEQIEQKMPGVMETRKVVSGEAAIAQGEADIVNEQKVSVEADLAEAIPILEGAIEALKTIKPNDINEIKALSKPPEKIRLVCKAVCIMQGIKPVRIPDPDDPSKRIQDYWGPSQKMLADQGFLLSLETYDKDNMSTKLVTEVKRDYIDHPDFQPDVIAKASKAAEGMCLWVHAMYTYDKVAKVVAPKKIALQEAEEKLNVTMTALNTKKAALQAVEDDLAALEAQLQGAKDEKLRLETSADNCDKKIGRANQLLDGLGGERARWIIFAEELGVKYKKLTGDILVSAGVIAYLGPFTALYRQKQMFGWVNALKAKDINCSDKPSLAGSLGDPVRIRQWHIEGLPTDGFSIENGIVVFNARRWPLMIDPQGQANKWIRNMEKANSLEVIKLTDPSYLRTLENAIQFGKPVLLENAPEELDPSLEPLLQKQIFKEKGVNSIRLGDKTIEYSDSFRFYITSKLRNPHYLPEVSVKVTLLNFMITPEGLQDQLLGIVVSQERPDLEEQRNKLIVESAENKRQLKEIEDQILHIMSSSSGNILEDESAITTLKNSKILSDEISTKQAIADETEKNINEVRQSYAPVSYSSQILFFCIADLANIEPVYQYSLTWFISLFISSINNSEKGRDVERRLFNLDEHFTYSLYRNVCRSLLEKDKLLFSFLLTARIMAGKDKLNKDDWFFLLTGGMGMSNPNPNPAEKWLLPKYWDAVCRLAELPNYSTFKEDFALHVDEWEKIYDSLSPQEEEFPGIFKSITGVGRLCALRTIRPDKVVLAIQMFVRDEMGEKFIKPPPFDLQSCYQDSSAIVPLVFILSAGSDPMGAVLRAGELLNTPVYPISLGQGQGPKAQKLIETAKDKGYWVVLQNCHLAPSWMTTLERICEELDPDPEITKPGFRLWCTTYPSDVFPVSVLQNGVKMTNEPPKGLRANLLGSFNADPIANESFFNSCSKSFEFHRLIFGLCFFHALVQERRLYGPLGWNIPYEFNESDLRISVQQLLLFLNENDEVPFKALVYTAGECNYGGRVTDDKDRRTLNCILKRIYNPTFLEPEHDISPSGIFTCPKDGDRDWFMEFIDQMPLIAAPEVFGMHDNATLTKDQNDTNTLLASTLDTEGGGDGGGSGGASKETILTNLCAEIAESIPDNFDIEFAQLKYPVRWDESMNTVVCQELIRFNNLLTLVRDSLRNLQKAIKGLVVMSAELDALGNQLFISRIPVLWKTRSYPSLKPLGSYVLDLQARLTFFRDWLVKKPPIVFWISGFFFTQAFLTGVAQNFARKFLIPIDDVVFDFEQQAEDSFDTPPANGVYTTGLFLEGSRWDYKTMELAESLPKVLFSLAPICLWQPFRTKDVPSYPHYMCPVYKTSDRRGVLATTGHSSNFVCFIKMPSSVPEAHWVERGVAMLTQLDD